MAKPKSECPDLVSSIQTTADGRKEVEEHRPRSRDVIQDVKAKITEMQQQLKSDTKVLERNDKIDSPRGQDTNINADLADQCEKMWWSIYTEVVKAHKALEETEWLECKRERGLLSKYPLLPQINPSSASGQKAHWTAPQQDTRVSQKTAKRVLELLCEKMSFLIQSDTLAALSSREKDVQTLLKSDIILSAIGIQTEEKLHELFDFILNYAKKGKPQKECEEGEEEEEEEEEPADLINPNDILRAMKEFITK